MNFTLNAAELDKIAREAEAHAPAAVDPEPVYRQAAILAFCGKKEIAVSLLRTAIAEDYCASGALQSDPLLSKLRETPEFGQLLAAAKDCQRKYFTTQN